VVGKEIFSSLLDLILSKEVAAAIMGTQYILIGWGLWRVCGSLGSAGIILPIMYSLSDW